MFDYENNRHVKVKDYRIQGDHDIYLSGLEKGNSEKRDSIAKPKFRCTIVKAGVFNENSYCGRI